MDNEAARRSSFQDFKTANAQDKAMIAKEKAKMAHSKFKETCTGRTLKLTNYVAVGLLAFGWVFRFVFMFSGEEKGPHYSGFWFFLETMIYGILIAVVALSLHPNEENMYSQLVRINCRLLDFHFGRGIFIFFLALQMCEVVANGEVVYALVASVISLIDMYLGYPVFKQSMLALSGEGNDAVGVDIGEPDKAEEDKAQYRNVNANSSRDTNNEVVLDTDQSTEFSGKQP